MAGEGSWVNLIVSKVAVQNRSAKPVKNVQIGWVLKEIDNKGDKLLQGSTTTFEVQLPAASIKLRKIPFIKTKYWVTRQLVLHSPAPLNDLLPHFEVSILKQHVKQNFKLLSPAF